MSAYLVGACVSRISPLTKVAKLLAAALVSSWVLDTLSFAKRSSRTLIDCEFSLEAMISTDGIQCCLRKEKEVCGGADGFIMCSDEIFGASAEDDKRLSFLSLLVGYVWRGNQFRKNIYDNTYWWYPSREVYGFVEVYKHPILISLYHTSPVVTSVISSMTLECRTTACYRKLKWLEKTAG